MLMHNKYGLIFRKRETPFGLIRIIEPKENLINSSQEKKMAVSLVLIIELGGIDHINSHLSIMEEFTSGFWEGDNDDLDFVLDNSSQLRYDLENMIIYIDENQITTNKLTLPIEDFKQLLIEWKSFLQT